MRKHCTQTALGRHAAVFISGLIAVILAVIFVDQDVSRWFSRDAQIPLRNAARHITDIALGEYWFGLALVIYVVSAFVWKRETPKRWSLHFFFALLGSGILLQTLKALIGRQRPHKSETLDALVFQPLTTDWHFHSMPSGHTQVMFTVATCAALLWPRAAFLMYSVAGVISFTRVMTLQHFVSDVIAGAMVGHFGTRLVHHLLRTRRCRPSKT